jgi:uncharacterized protein (TIGR02449 family)
MVATYHSAMLANLDQLADGIQQLASLVQRLRDENRFLRLELMEVKGEARLLQERLNAARTRVEALIERLPADG